MDYQLKPSIFVVAIHEVLNNGSIALKHSELLAEFLLISDGAINWLSRGASAVPSPILCALLGAEVSGFSSFRRLLVQRSAFGWRRCWIIFLKYGSSRWNGCCCNRGVGLPVEGKEAERWAPKYSNLKYIFGYFDEDPWKSPTKRCVPAPSLRAPSLPWWLRVFCLRDANLSQKMYNPGLIVVTFLRVLIVWASAGLKVCKERIRNWFLYTCWKSSTPAFEAAAIDVTDGTHPCFHFCRQISKK